MAEERLALSSSGQVRYTLKTPYRDGTTHIVLEPLDLMARLAALVPPPRHVAMNWARRLQRVFGVEIEACARCGGGELKILASIEEPEVIARILAHLRRTAPEQYQSELPLGGAGARLPAALVPDWPVRAVVGEGFRGRAMPRRSILAGWRPELAGPGPLSPRREFAAPGSPGLPQASLCEQPQAGEAV